MQVDIIAGVLVLIGVWLGWRSGGVLQILRLLVAVASVGLAYVVAGELARFYQGYTSTTALAAVGSSFFASLAVIWFALSLFLGRFTRDMSSVAEDLPILSRLVGLVAGAARGAVVAYLVVLGMMLVFETRGSLNLPYDESRAATWIRARNVLARPVDRLIQVMDDEDRKLSPYRDVDEVIELGR